MTTLKELQEYYYEHQPTSHQLNTKTHRWFKNELKKKMTFIESLKGEKKFGLYINALKLGLTEPPPCECCGEPVKSVRKTEFSKFCSTDCRNKIVPLKMQETTKNRYGGMGNASTIIKEKAVSTNKKRYGAESYMQTDAFREKSKKTVQENYGVDHVSKSKEVQKKKLTNRIQNMTPIEYENYKWNQMDSFERWGADHYMKTEEGKKIQQKAFMEKYGVTNPGLIKASRNKMKATCFEKYGCEWYTQKHIPIESYDILDDLEKLKLHYDGYDSISHAAETLGVSSHLYGRKLRSHGIEIKEPKNRMSDGHREILAFLASLGIDESEIQNNMRGVLNNKMLEVDIFLESYGICIEYNGWYWHSDIYRGMKYHQEKSIQALESGYRMVHVWEYDWKDETKQSIIKHKLQSMLGMSDRVYARKCHVEEVDNSDAKSFYDNTHIQGYKYSFKHYGLKETRTGELVALLSISRKDVDNGIVEISRYSTSKTVVGGFSKLLKYMSNEVKPNVIETFCSLDYGNGRMYEVCGFDKVSTTKPNYKYVKRNVVISRNKAMKHKLEKLLEDFNPDMTEYENMTNHGFFRVYDSGSFKYVLEKKKPLE